MRPGFLPVVGVGAAALLAATAFAGQASARTTAPFVHQGAAAAHPAAPAKKACYSQTGADSGTGILSTATSDPAGYTSTGAMDFKVKKRCVISTVTATGVYAGGSGPADSFTVTFYKSKAGLPGKVVNTQTISGSFPSPVLSLSIAKVTLKKGSYFATVQGNMDYASVGGWYWETTNTPQNGVDVWENNGGAFGNCTTWATLSTCFGLNSDFIGGLS